MQEKIGATRKLRSVIAAALAFVCLAALLPGRAQAAPELSARSAVLLDCATGRVLYEKDAGARRLIASTTKIMTGLLITERCPLDEAVTIPAAACGMEGSSLYLKPGEVLTVEQLLYGLLLQSGNDAAVALALHCSGSVPAFVAEMNRRAAALGLRDTHFANPNGLDDDGNYATARDLAYLAAYAMKQPAFARIAATKTASIPGRSLRNHNKLLWRYDGCLLYTSILPEALEPHQDQARGLGADGTVRRINDDLGRIFNELQGVFRGVAVQHALQHGRQLPQADPARDAFAAGLRMTEI